MTTLTDCTFFCCNSNNNESIFTPSLSHSLPHPLSKSSLPLRLSTFPETAPCLQVSLKYDHSFHVIPDTDHLTNTRTPLQNRAMFEFLQLQLLHQIVWTQTLSPNYSRIGIFTMLHIRCLCLCMKKSNYPG